MKKTASRPARLPDTQAIANVGLYYVCYRLSRYGWSVSPATRNARTFDIFASSQDGSRTRAILVRATSVRGPVLLGTHLDRVVGDFVVVCRSVLTETPESFLLTPEEARALAVPVEMNGSTSYWLQPRAYDRPEFREAWQLLGVDADHKTSPARDTHRTRTPGPSSSSRGAAGRGPAPGASPAR